MAEKNDTVLSISRDKKHDIRGSFVISIWGEGVSMVVLVVFFLNFVHSWNLFRPVLKLIRFGCCICLENLPTPLAQVHQPTK